MDDAPPRPEDSALFRFVLGVDVYVEVLSGFRGVTGTNAHPVGTEIDDHAVGRRSAFEGSKESPPEGGRTIHSSAVGAGPRRLGLVFSGHGVTLSDTVY